MTKLRKKILLIFIPLNLAFLISGIAYGTYVGLCESIGEEAFSCFCRKNFNFYCPGCGGSRSLYYLINFRLFLSFLYFPALPVAVFLILLLDVFALISFIKNKEAILKKFNPNLLIIIPAVIILNFLIRNVLLYLGIDYIGDLR